MIFAGGVLHLLVVLLPFVFFGGSLLDPAVLVFTAGASALYFGDAVTMRWTSLPSSSPLDVSTRRWAALTGGVLLLVFWASTVQRAFVQPVVSWTELLGALLLVGGVLLRARAVRALGPNFRTEIDLHGQRGVDGELVQRGVYRYLRHPSETGLLAAALGAAVLLQSVWGALLWGVALVPITIARLSLEERALYGRFGESYRRYAEDVGGLFPRAPVLTSISSSRHS